MGQESPDLLGLPYRTLEKTLDDLGIGRVQASRVYATLHRKNAPLTSERELGRHARTLEEQCWIASTVADRVVEAEDGTRKLLFRLHDGAAIEAVLIPMAPGRATLCVSSQVGCAMGCRFCATGTMGLGRNLRAGEIVAQVHAARKIAAETGRKLTRLVFMGMGEPLHNTQNVVDAIDVLMDKHGLSLGSRQIMVSTVGLTPGIASFADAFDGKVQLALSLHAGTDATRQQIVPTASKYPLAVLKQALADFPMPGSRYLMLEYVVLPGVNDTEDELDGVAAFADGLDAVVNLIPFNPFPGADYRSPTPDELKRMQAGLRSRGLLAKIRWPRGRSEAAACGQLALRA